MSQTEIEAHFEFERSWNLNHVLSGKDGLHLTADDVVLVPNLGRLESRSDAKLGRFIYSSPMDTVTGENLANKIVEQGHFAVACRFLPEEWFRTFASHYNNKNVFFAIGSKEKDSEALITAIQLAVPENVEPAVSVNIDVAHGDTIHLHKLYTH